MHRPWFACPPHRGAFGTKRRRDTHRKGVGQELGVPALHAWALRNLRMTVEQSFVARVWCRNPTIGVRLSPVP